MNVLKLSNIFLNKQLVKNITFSYTKFIALQICYSTLRKSEDSQINNLPLYLKELQ